MRCWPRSILRLLTGLVRTVIEGHLNKGGMRNSRHTSRTSNLRRFVSAARTCIVSSPSSLSMFRWIVARDLMLAWRRRSDVFSTLFFFVIVVSLFPLGIGPETQLLRSIAPGVVWVAALLASMLALGRMFANDYQDGTLEQLLLTPQPLYLMVLGKILAQWLVSEVPLILIAPLLGMQFHLPAQTLLCSSITLLIGTPVLSLIGSIGAALTLGIPRRKRVGCAA